MVTFKRLSREAQSQFDLIVVGAGSAGWLVASRLSKHFSVALLEFGEQTTRRPQIRRPADYLKRFGTSDDWAFQTTPQKGLAGRQINLPRGRGVGGSTRINASIWLPPTAECLSAVAEQSGGRFSTLELANAVDEVSKIIQPEEPRWLSTASRLACQAAGKLGIPFRPFLRMNARGQRRLVSDFSFTDSTSPENETSPAWTCFTNCFVHRLILAGNVAQGVVVNDGTNQETFELYASKGVVLAAGTIGTPLLLQRSGIGPPDVLAEAAIDLRVTSDSVGRNLADHLVMPLVSAWHTGDSQAGPAKFVSSERFPVSWSVRDLARWQLVGSGPATSNLAEAGGFVGSGAKQVQLFVTPTDYLRHPSHRSPAAMTVGVVPSRPASRGSVRLAPQQSPEHRTEHGGCSAISWIDPGYLTDPGDMSTLLRGVETARELLACPPLRSALAQERIPGAGRLSPKDLSKSIARYAQTLYHPVGTCRLGDDEEAVVNPQFQVRHCGQLWVVDASLLASPPAANPNPLVLSIAWLAAETIGETLA